MAAERNTVKGKDNSVAGLIKRVNQLEHQAALQQTQIDALGDKFVYYYRRNDERPSLGVILSKNKSELANLLVLGEYWSGGLTVLLDKPKVGVMDNDKGGKWEPMVIPMELLKLMPTEDLLKDEEEADEKLSALKDASSDTPALLS
ncbi:MAG: hypothetical protein K2W95_00855 [Candidatus Obscuribacterales bacterium]|nr:hypothetical protein [Candidatus Obscuribacterales bacterium]